MSSKPNTPNPRRRESRRKLHRSSGIYKIHPQSPKVHYPVDGTVPLESDSNLERLESLADAVEQLETHMVDLSRIHNAVSNGFNEPFASFLYGLLITMFCNNFPGCPTREPYGEIQRTETAESRVRSLQERVRLAKLENKRLQEEVARKARENKNDVLRKTPAPPRPVRQPLQAARKKVTVAQDDTYSTTDSFIETPANRKTSRIPQPKITTPTGPNLNQPPRYMRGLFDKTGSSNSLRNREVREEKPRARPVRAKATRPPFR